MAASLARGNPICRKEDCSRFDLGLVYKEISRYSDLAEKFELIQNVWKSDLHFKFPQNEEFRKQRKFRQDWLIRYPWLIYSKYLDGALCNICLVDGNMPYLDGAFIVLLFRSRVRQVCYQAWKAFQKSRLTHFWTVACVKFQRHASGKCETHNFPIVAMHNFIVVSE